MIEVPNSVSAPIPAPLSPYFCLEAEAEQTTPEARFEGWWAAVWLNNLRCIQLSRAEGHAIGRTIGLEDEARPGARLETLRDATFFITVRDESLELALEAEVPTILVRNGDPRVDPLPPLCSRFAPDKLRVLHAHTSLRRDVTLSSLQANIEYFAPGSCRFDGGESQMCRDRLSPYLRGTIAGLGHGACKIRAGAVGVDVFRYDERDWIGDVRDMHFFADEAFDSVYSSHCLEDLWDPHQALDEWMRILKPDGHLSLDLPMRGYYPSVGTPGANPGHKDDNVPEDVEAFLRDIGGNEVVHSKRFESELSFEVVARKSARRSYSIATREVTAPAERTPEQVDVSVLIVGGARQAAETQKLIATIESAERSLEARPHEILVLLRERSSTDDLAALRDLALRCSAVQLIEDLNPLTYPARIAKLARKARGDLSIVLASGSICLEGSLTQLVEAHEQRSSTITSARVLDVLGRSTEPGVAAATAACIATAELRAPAFASSPYTTPCLFTALTQEREETPEASGLVIGDGIESFGGNALGRLAFDLSLVERQVPVVPDAAKRILVAALRTMGDAILATCSLDALAERWPGAEIDVLTETDNAWVFERHPAVARVLTCSDSSNPANEEAATQAALESAVYDRYQLLCTRSDSVEYCSAGGIRLAEYYALQAGLDAGGAGQLAPSVWLAQGAREGMRAKLGELGVTQPYAVLHTRAGWESKSLSKDQARHCVDALAEQGLPVVVVGGPGELVAHPRALNLAGMLTAEASASVIAGAHVYVGPDSGCLHLASSYGVPSLAFYAGSHPWIAPPLALGSESLLSSTTCARPCGQCAPKTCGMRGVTENEIGEAIARLCERARALEDAAPDEATPANPVHRTLLRGREVVWIDGPKGPQSLTGAAHGRRTTTPHRAQGRRLLERTGRASVHELQVEKQHLQRAIEARRSETRAATARLHVASALEAQLEGMSRRARVASLVTLAKQAIDARQQGLALSHLMRAARVLQAAVDGCNGRRRPAFGSMIDDIFAFAATVSAGSPSEAIVPFLSFWSEHIDRDLPGRFLIRRLSDYALGEEDKETQSALHAALARIDEDELSLQELRIFARLMQQLGDITRSEGVLAERSRRVADPEHRAMLEWDRVPALLSAPTRVDELKEALQIVAQHSKNPLARPLAIKLQANLTRHAEEVTP